MGDSHLAATSGGYTRAGVSCLIKIYLCTVVIVVIDCDSTAVGHGKGRCRRWVKMLISFSGGVGTDFLNVLGCNSPFMSRGKGPVLNVASNVCQNSATRRSISTVGTTEDDMEQTRLRPCGRIECVCYVYETENKHSTRSNCAQEHKIIDLPRFNAL